MKNRILLLTLFVLSVFVQAQQKQVQQDSTEVERLDEVLLSATRAKDKTPVAFSNISKEELESTNLGQDLPILLDQMPSVVTTSDAGAGVGYTGIRVRGTDATRVNVTINGIPYNDAESQGTFWVNMPDFVSSVEDIQLQRGVGTSTNGSGAFGASLNIKTLQPSSSGYATTTNVIGSYGTRKHNLSLGSGLKNNFYAEARLSKIMSDGYIDRASSDLSSYYVEGGYLDDNTSLKAMVFGGKEKTYQSWYGTPEAVVKGDLQGIQDFIDRNYLSQSEADNLLNSGRTYNYYTYDNEVDNYEQTHYQLHFSHQFNKQFSANLSGNYTRGKGYFEQYKNDETVGDYFPNDLDADATGDAIRRRWLDNDFYAIVSSFNYKKEHLNLYVGGGYNKYDGDHFGELIWDSYPVTVPIRTNYYFSVGEKSDYNAYVKAEYTLNYSWFLFADVQYRHVDYKSDGLSSDLLPINVSEKYNFFNPKAGLTYTIDNYNSVYGSLAVANREPNRDDLTKNPVLPNPERLVDYELGYKLKTLKYYATANLYYMDYKDQLVLTGDLDNVGGPIRENVKDSYRAGVELQAGYKFSDKLRLDANATFSKNKIKAFDYVVYDTQYDPNTWETVAYEPVVTSYENTDISFSPNIIAGGTLRFTPLESLNLAFISKYVGKQYLDNTSSASKSMDAYFVNNFNASYKIQPKWIKEIAFNLLVNNIFDNEYVSNGYTYSYYYRPQGSNDDAITENFYYPQAKINFLLGMTLKF
ncbi:TonB-dependent receptor [Aestuariibaculum sediminum]|uniref:TonB-dependent receptor n=1 Tax=Aestuariibaculum sediminum TaxID=2770637 RepID=A0A8J6Q6P8_9FLAO|nr:TonB-dependent receptor [Aestuariibaculum sediminum]MBD0830975.1 TonB-dependent receptor [Aestuariibaculum sediminum]